MSDDPGPSAVSGPPVPPAAAVPPPGGLGEDHEADEELWPQLLDYIEQGTVVPVVGRDLLTFDAPVEGGSEPQTILLYSALAAALAKELKVTVDEAAFTGPNPLGVVASEYIVRGEKPSRIYTVMPRLLQRILPERLPLPRALQQLAEITPFRVFVTTTFDPLLVATLQQVRRELPRVLQYTPYQATDELETFAVGTRRQETLQLLKGLPASTVVHILGRISNTPNYVVTEEDAFEFVYSLHETRPSGFFELLGQMRLLIVGCRFPGWLVRFFLRTARRKRLLQTDLDRSDFVVDPMASEDASLVQFLRNFRTQTEIFTTYGPTAFVNELAARWDERQKRGQDASEEPMTRCSVFISYASENVAAAAELAGQLREARLPVWLDQDRLGSGDEWARKIQKNIAAASAFVPIMSRATLAEGSREFRREWRHAAYIKAGLPPNEPFIYPVVIDDVPRGSDAIDEWLRNLDWQEHTPGTPLPERFLDRLRQSFRGAQMRAYS